MIAIIYNGDIRFNQSVVEKNHEKFLSKLKKISDIKIYRYTKDDPLRGVCPFDGGGVDKANEGHYRRGQGGAVQVWDFLQSVDRVNEDIVIRMRTDTWFTESSILVIINEIQKILNNKSDIAFFGSDLINNNAGVEYKETPIEYKDSLVIPTKIQDFVIVAKKTSLYSLEHVIEVFNKLPYNKLRSGNKNFRQMIAANSRGKTIVCNIFLIRKYFDAYPTDIEVFENYIDSYIEPTGKKIKIQKQKEQMKDAYKVLERWKNK